MSFIETKIEKERVIKGFSKYEDDVIKFIPSSLEISGKFVRNETIPLTPTEQGYLETSFDIFVEGNQARFRMSGEDNPKANGYDYAKIQHETESFNHPLRGEAHYLEKGLNEATPEIIEFIETGVYLLSKKQF